MNVQFLKSKEKQQIIDQLNAKFGISELKYLLIESGKEKIRGFSGSLSRDELLQLSEIANIEIIGLYLMKRETNKEGNEELRLSFDAPLMLKDQISKNIVNIDDKTLSIWIRGNDISANSMKGAVIIKNNSDFIGCGLSNGEKVFNYVPKDRRLRK